MYIRLTYVNYLPGKIEEAKRLYEEEITPIVKKQKGNLDCRMLEPVNKGDDYISMTVWETKEDADNYQNTGVYKKLVDRFKNLFSKEPVLKVYTSEGVPAHA